MKGLASLEVSFLFLNPVRELIRIVVGLLNFGLKSHVIIFKLRLTQLGIAKRHNPVRELFTDPCIPIVSAKDIKVCDRIVGLPISKELHGLIEHRLVGFD